MPPALPTPVDHETLTPPRVGHLRLLIGLLQGALLYLLYRAAADQAWPATVPPLFVALVLAGVVGPVLLVSSLGHLPRRALVAWVLAATVIAAALGSYDGWRQVVETMRDHARAALAPTAPLVLATIAGFFIAHALVLTGYAERRRVASYHGYFETAWKLGVQLGFSVLFTGAAWLVLTLGAELFMLVKLPLFRQVIGKPWFAIPATVFAFTAAMHITDVRPGIVRGIRSLLLTLMGWILPIATLIIAAFLLSLPFTGLAPLWATRSAAALMLIGIALLVVLINAAWQDGAALPDAAAPIRVAARLACALLLPLWGLATYALTLRVTDHGWTHDRIVAAACLVVALCYATGYLLAACRQARLDALAGVNIGTAFVVVAVLLALFTPVANPERIAVASQLARLDAGKVSAQKFDYAYLRFHGGRYGRDALAALAARTGPDAPVLRQGVAAARAMETRWSTPVKAIPTDFKHIQVWPAGATLPASFASQTITPGEAWRTPACLRDAATACDAFMVDVMGDTRPEVVIVEPKNHAAVMAQDAAGMWAVAGFLPDGIDACAPLHAAIVAGNVGAVPRPNKDLVIGGKTLPVDYVDGPAKLCDGIVPAR